MFRKKHQEELVNETENSEHCFIVFEKHEIYQISRWGLKPAGECMGFINHPFHKDNDPEGDRNFDKLMSPERTSYFSFQKELDAKSGRAGNLEFLIDKRYEIRLSVKINMSLEQLNGLLGSVDSDWFGNRASQAGKILEAAARESYVDVKDKKTNEWYRIETREFNQKPTHKHTCQIL